MRCIGTLESERAAKRFRDYLLTTDVTARVEADDGQWNIWVFNEDQLDRARDELQAFRQDPEAQQYRDAVQKAESLREAARHVAPPPPPAPEFESPYAWDRPRLQDCPLTLGLIAVCIIVAVASQLGQQIEPVVSTLSIAPLFDRAGKMYWHPNLGLQAILHGEAWRLVTPIFLHFGILHILFNMMWLRELGTMIEFRRGWLWMAAFVVLVACLSNYGQYLENGPVFGGMSGVVYAMFGYIWMRQKADPGEGVRLPPNTEFWMLGWFVLCLLDIIPNVANTAHGVGLVVGMIVGFVPVRLRNWLAR